MNDGVFLSTDQVEPKLRNDFWRALLRPLFDVFATECDGRLEGSMLLRPIGQLTVASVRFNHQRHVRDSMSVANSGFDNYLLHFIVSGVLQAESGRTTVSARSGDICLFDLALPFATRTEAGQRISLAIPRERIDRAAGGRRIHGLHLRSDDPLTQMLGRMIQDLYRGADNIAATDVAVQSAIIDFIAAIVADRARRSWPDAPLPERSLRQHVISFIEDHLGRSELGPAMLMRQFQISRAHLYRVFAPDNGVATVIRDRRLDAAYRRLTGGNHQRPSVTEIAYELGFTSSGQFSRAFRNRFGLSPRAVQSGEHSIDAGVADGHTGTLLQRHFMRQAKCWAGSWDANTAAHSIAEGEHLADIGPCRVNSMYPRPSERDAHERMHAPRSAPV